MTGLAGSQGGGSRQTRRLVIVGYMRRYDPGYMQVKATLESGAIGEPLILHNVHRNAVVPETFTSFMTMTDSMIHEVDVSRWLLDEEITAVQVIAPKRTPNAFPHLQDPQFAVFTTESGILSTVEFFANCQYGYDVRCELVGPAGAWGVPQGSHALFALTSRCRPPARETAQVFGIEGASRPLPRGRPS